MCGRSVCDDMTITVRAGLPTKFVLKLKGYKKDYISSTYKSMTGSLVPRPRPAFWHSFHSHVERA